MNVDGQADTRGFWFKFEENTEVYQSCSLNFKGRSYVYGGSTERYQLSVVDGCALKRIADLPFSFNHGACTSTPGQVFLCFEDGTDLKTCRQSQSATGPFAEVDTSIYAHKRIGIAASSSKSHDFNIHVRLITRNNLADILAVGSEASSNLAEIYMLNPRQWHSVDPYPFEGTEFDLI